eukprot:jgi/Chrzof1/12927/Cz07g12180.t1
MAVCVYGGNNMITSIMLSNILGKNALVSGSTCPAVHVWFDSIHLVRSASTKARSGKKKSNFKGYDKLLHTWNKTVGRQQKRKMTSQPQGWWHTIPYEHDRKGSTKASERSFGFAASSSKAASKRSKPQHKASQQRTNWSSSAHSSWDDSFVDEDTLHSILFGEGNSSSRSSRKKYKKVQQKARKAAWWRARGAAAYAEYGFEDSDDEEEAGHHHTEDWKWWDDAQEREWLRMWQQHQQQAKTGWQNSNSSSYKRHQQQQQQHSSSSRQDSSHWHHTHHHSQHARAWWEQFQSRAHQHYHQQQQQQHAGARHSQYAYGGSSSFVGHSPVTQEYLHVLGLSHDNQLDRTSIKAAFHKAAIQWHPDKHVSTADKADAEAKFKRAKEAYEGLTSLCA